MSEIPRHHGDCDIWGCGICTCGLFHDLDPILTTEALAHHEKDFARHKRIIESLSQIIEALEGRRDREAGGGA